jgi:hypothetical protein
MKTEVKRYRESNKKILNVCKRSSRRHWDNGRGAIYEGMVAKRILELMNHPNPLTHETWYPHHTDDKTEVHIISSGEMCQVSMSPKPTWSWKTVQCSLSTALACPWVNADYYVNPKTRHGYLSVWEKMVPSANLLTFLRFISLIPLKVERLRDQLDGED